MDILQERELERQIGGRGARGVGRTQGGSIALNRGVKRGPEHNPWFWNPNRVGAYQAPSSFMTRVKEVDPDGLVDIRWNPIRERWGVWAKAPRVQNPICSGWKLLFLVELEGQFVPLDERVLVKLWDRSGRRHGNLWEYWLKVEAQIERDRERAASSRTDDVRHAAGEYFDYTKIKNIGSGSKFANNHSE